MKNKKTLLIVSIIAIAVATAGIVIYNTKQKKDEQLKVFATQVESFKDLNNTYNIKNSKEYTDLLNESQKALESNDLNQINLIEKTISKFKDQLTKENSQELETLISEIKKIDISKLKNKINFENQLNDINNLKADQSFKEAIQRAIQLKATIIKEKADFDVAEKKRLDEKAKSEKKAKEQEELNKLLKFINHAAKLDSTSSVPYTHITPVTQTNFDYTNNDGYSANLRGVKKSPKLKDCVILGNVPFIEPNSKSPFGNESTSGILFFGKADPNPDNIQYIFTLQNYYTYADNGHGHISFTLDTKGNIYRQSTPGETPVKIN